jgi:DNA-binding XRE family transcriptional regulator
MMEYSAMDKGKKLFVAHYMNVISNNVKKLRGDLNQEDFAKKVGISRTTVHRIESRRNFQIESLLKIADSFGLYPHDLCLSDDDKKKIVFSLDAMVETIKETIKNEILEEIKRTEYQKGTYNS